MKKRIINLTAVLLLAITLVAVGSSMYAQTIHHNTTTLCTKSDKAPGSSQPTPPTHG